MFFFPDSADACPKFIDCPVKGLICWLGLAWLEVPKHPISSSVESGQHIMNQFLPGASTWPRSCEILWPHRHVQSCMWILVCVGTRDVWRPQVDSFYYYYYYLLYSFFWYWGLNPEPYTCWIGVLTLMLSPVLLMIIKYVVPVQYMIGRL